MAEKSIKTIAQNKKAYHDYFVEEKYEAGIELFGTEVKSLRAGKVNLKDSFCKVYGGELLALGIHISPYEQGNIFNKDPLRTRKMLLHKSEIRRLIGKVKTDGYTIVPVKIYFKGNYAKVQIALAKGKKLYDKRQDIAKKDQRREAEKSFKIQKMY